MRPGHPPTAPRPHAGPHLGSRQSQLGAKMHARHATPWARCHSTSLSDTVLLCDTSHRDLHEGHRRIRLKDGRVLGPDGWVSDQ